MRNEKNKLAILGGNKVINYDFKKYKSIGSEELNAASKVIKSGVLSQYLARWHDNFYGGKYVQLFEKECEKHFKVKHAITVNSWTSGLIAAVGALDIEPGDEILVPTWTMSASATAILHWNAIPVFVDIEPVTFCIDTDSVKENITQYTKAIMAVDIFGHSANMKELRKIADENELKLISDSAQSPGGYYKGHLTGTIADVGGFSLNYHKHIHTGEGGIVVTNDDKIAFKSRLIRNHGESVIGSLNEIDLVNIVGHNFRLGEIECATGIEQLKKLNTLVLSRQVVAKKLTEGLKGLQGLNLPYTEDESTHAFYVYPMTLNINELDVSRDQLIKSLKAEGVEGLMSGYVNLHMLPMYQNKIAYGSKGFPWNSNICRRKISYDRGICPNAEKLHNETFIGLQMCLFELQDFEINGICAAFHKIWNNLDKIRKL